MAKPYINKVLESDALDLLQKFPSGSVHNVISDAMFGTSKACQYDWGVDPARGNPERHWEYHQPIYEECLRVLRPGGVLAWCQGWNFLSHFDDWFGGYRAWPLSLSFRCVNYCTAVWIVQTREKKKIEHPNDVLVKVDVEAYRRLKNSLDPPHPCPKSVEECLFMVENLTQPGEIVLDPFCGLGSTLVAAQQLGRRWIGCDRSKRYCQVARERLAAKTNHHYTTCKESIMKKKNTTTTPTTERPEVKEALLDNIVRESRSIGTDATRRSATIGDLSIQHGDRKAIQQRLKKEGLDSNVSRAIGVYTLTQLVPEAMGLPIGVVAKFTPMVKYSDKPDYAKEVYGEYVPDLIRRALKDGWTAAKAAEEAAKVRTPDKRAQKPQSKGLEKALALIVKTPVKDLARAIVSNQKLWDHLEKALYETNSKTAKQAAA